MGVGGRPGSGRSDHYHHGMLHSLFMFSISEVVHYRKSVKQRKPKAAIKGACHRLSKSVLSVDGQKNANKNWSVQPEWLFD